MVINSGKSLHLAYGFTYARRTLKALTAIALLFAVISLITFPFKLNLGHYRPDSSLNPELGSFGSLKTSEMLAADFSTHSLFYLPRKEMAASGPGLDEVLRSFHLVGIIQGETPEALIKNDTNQQTYFARSGEKFDRFHVAEILNNSIKVEFEGQNKEMFLEEGIS